LEGIGIKMKKKSVHTFFRSIYESYNLLAQEFFILRVQLNFNVVRSNLRGVLFESEGNGK
jgi:hypothetical protein